MASHADSRYIIPTKHKVSNTPSYVQQNQPTSNSTFEAWDFEYPWSQGLCSCTNQCDEMCYGLWCCPCFTCQLMWHLHESCWITCCVPGHLAILRTKVRTAFRIQGSYVGDFCTSEFCPLCTVLQIAGELRARKK